MKGNNYYFVGSPRGLREGASVETVVGTTLVTSIDAVTGGIVVACSGAAETRAVDATSAPADGVGLVGRCKQVFEEGSGGVAWVTISTGFKVAAGST